ncbi:PmoA family protein [Parasediminibacterium paludis]|uniref:PmoA family protein n=1 Tax=Parasediminibacterium paludis TaxID=908966 RepID=A0ABV8PVH7_9BACT
MIKKYLSTILLSGMLLTQLLAQQMKTVSVIKVPNENKINITIGNTFFTSFLYPDSLEKPVLYPIETVEGTLVTRGFPLNPKPNDPTDHPHHIGLWFNYENVNGLDFWNNSYAIPANKKSAYGWVKTDKILETKSGEKGLLRYHANWNNQQNETLLEETTTYEFSEVGHKRIIDRVTTLRANTDVTFSDAKDGLLGLRLAHELQIPTDKDQKFTDDKGIVTIVKGGTDKMANGNYVTSEGKVGDSAWSTRASWCKVFGKMNNDSVSIVIIDHPKNPNYPTFWHARGYGLFAANPLGEKIFTNGKSAKNLKLAKGETVTFRYRVVIDEGKNSISEQQIAKFMNAFVK